MSDGVTPSDAWTDDPAGEQAELADWLDRIKALEATQRANEAISLCEQALSCHPGSPFLWSELGSLYLAHGSWEAAEMGFRAALQRSPGHPELLFNLSVALQRQWRLDEAANLLQQTLERDPSHHKAWSNLASVLGWQGHHAQEKEALERSLALAPGDPEYRWNRALAWLRQGRFADGWRDYEARYEFMREPPAPCTWDGQPLPGSTLWVACEQGLGDTLQFLRFLPWARARVGRLLLACPSALKPFLDAQAVADEVHASDGAPPPGMPSVRLLSLPHLMRLASPADIPRTAYLRAESSRVQAMARRLSPWRRPRVALSWQGSKAYGADARRSMRLAELLPLLRAWNADFFSVQRGEGSEQLAQLPADVTVQPLREGDDRDGAFMDTAALLMNVDLTVCTDSAMAHLSGGLGVPTLLLLARTPDWRWGSPEAPLAWYDSVRPVFQETAGDWQAVVLRLARSPDPRLPTS